MATPSNISTAASILLFMAIMGLVTFTSIAEARKGDLCSPEQSETPSTGNNSTPLFEGKKAEPSAPGKPGSPSPTHNEAIVYGKSGPSAPRQPGTPSLGHNEALVGGKSTPSAPGQPGTPSPGHNHHNKTAVVKVNACSNTADINILNQPTSIDGKWSVEIQNLCQDCPLSNLLLNCPGFASGSLINPNDFKTNGDGTCTVKNAGTMQYSEMVRFNYNSVFKKSLSVRSVTWHC